MDSTKNPSCENSPSTNKSKNFDKLCNEICQSNPNLLELKNKLIRNPLELYPKEILDYLKIAKNIVETIGEQKRFTQNRITNLFYDYLFTDYESWKEDFLEVTIEHEFPEAYKRNLNFPSNILQNDEIVPVEIPNIDVNSRNLMLKIMNYNLGDHPREELWFYAWFLCWSEGEYVSENSFFVSLYNLVSKFMTIYEVRENYNNMLHRKLLIKSREKSNENILIAKFPSATDWREISITFLSEFSVKIKIKDFIKNVNFYDLGFINRKNKKPNSLWIMLKILAENNGELSFQTNVDNRWKIKKEISELRKTLKSLFKIDDDPFHNYRKYKAYKTKFKLRSEIPPDDKPKKNIFNQMKEDLPEDYLDFNELK